jgi:hypothetical protein
MTDVVAISSFNHYGKTVKPGDRLTVSSSVASQLVKNRLAALADATPATIRPTQPSGAKLSASPAGPASPQTTAILSAAGEALAKLSEKRKPGRLRKIAP